MRGALSALGLVLALTCAPVRADVVAVVSAKNPVAALSKSQVVAIFLGKSTRFPDGAPAMPIDRTEGVPARDEFYSTFAGKSAAQIKAYWSKIIFTGRGQPPRTAADEAEVRKLLAADPQAIAYLERSSVDASVKVLVQP